MLQDETAMMKFVRSQVVESMAKPVAGEVEVTVNAVWNLKKAFQKIERDGLYSVNEVGRILVVTGGRKDAIATACGKYLETVWPREGTALLSLFCLYLNSGKERKACLKITDKQAHLAIQGYPHSGRKGVVSITIRASLDRAIDYAQQLAWLCAAFWTNSKHGLALSRCELSCAAPGVYDLKPLTLEYFKPAIDECNCWHRQFRNLVIVADFPIGMRKKEVGLELDIDFMQQVTGVKRIVRVSDGLQTICILSGKSTKLFQTAVMIPKGKEPDWMLPTIQLSLVQAKFEGSVNAEFTRARTFLGCPYDTCVKKPKGDSKIRKIARKARAVTPRVRYRHTSDIIVSRRVESRKGSDTSCDAEEDSGACYNQTLRF